MNRFSFIQQIFSWHTKNKNKNIERETEIKVCVIMWAHSIELLSVFG